MELYHVSIKWKIIFCFQASEYFHSAYSNAIEQQREIESRQIGEESLDTPLLLDQVLTLIGFIFVVLLTILHFTDIVYFAAV